MVAKNTLNCRNSLSRCIIILYLVFIMCCHFYAEQFQCFSCTPEDVQNSKNAEREVQRERRTQRKKSAMHSLAAKAIRCPSIVLPLDRLFACEMSFQLFFSGCLALFVVCPITLTARRLTEWVNAWLGS
jgi:hypothetical protein